MKLAIIGATGKAGSQIAKSAKARGWDVTGLARNAAEREFAHGDLVEGDATNVSQTAEAIEGADAVVLAIGPVPGEVNSLAESIDSVLSAVDEADVARLLIVGGAGTLRTPDGNLLMDSPTFPAASLPTAQAHHKALEELRAADTSVDWLYVSPAARFMPDGEERGSYQLGGDDLLATESGESAVSYADYASALLDQIESPSAHRARIAVSWR